MIGAVGRVGNIGGSRGRASMPTASPDFTLSNATVATIWGTVTVGELTPINAPPGVTFRLVQTSGAVGDEAGLAVVNG